MFVKEVLMGVAMWARVEVLLPTLLSRDTGVVSRARSGNANDGEGRPPITRAEGKSGGHRRTNAIAPKKAY